MTNLQSLLRPELRANITAHSLAFACNIFLYSLTASPLFIWTELACVCFIGANTAQSPNFFDRNIFNHFLSVMLYYLISIAIQNHPNYYVGLVFAFTYLYFILKGQGYNKSLNLWMYIQALLIGTTFTTYPFHLKLLATLAAYFEAQLILAWSFRIFGSPLQHQAERYYHHIFKVAMKSWLDPRLESVRLAIRGALCAGILYAICASYHDAKPNWAVVGAIACLQREDYSASIRAVKGVFIGTLLGWPLSYLLIHYVDAHTVLATCCVALFLLCALICSFEIVMQPRLSWQILSTSFFLLAVSSVAIALNINEYRYLNLKVINSLLGLATTCLALVCFKTIQVALHRFRRNARLDN